MAASNSAINSSARHAIFVQRVAGGLSNNFNDYLVEIKERTAAILLKDQPIDAILSDIRIAQKDIYDRYIDDVNKSLIELTQAEGAYAAKEIAKLSGRPANVPPTLWASVNTKPLEFVKTGQQKFLEPFIRDWSQEQIDRAANTIRAGVLQGQTLPEIAKEVASDRSLIGKQTAASNRTMVRTAVNHISNEARLITYESDSNIIGHEIVAKIDMRTSDICRDLNGNIYIYGVDNPILSPPFHPNCRTTTAPVFKDD